MIDIHPFLVEADHPIASAMAVIDKNAGHVALVVDGARRLVGTVSDGDIRRALLRGLTISDQVRDVMNPNPVTVSADAPHEEAFALMRRHVLRDIPVLDSEGRVVGLRMLSELTSPRRRDNPVVIMAGGLGMRLRPLTEACPKPMLKLGGRPLLETMIDRLMSFGYWQFYLAVNYKAEVIIEHFGDGSSIGAEIRYLHEEKALGTAGALHLLPHKPSMPLIVLNGDVLTMVDFPSMVEFHHEHEAAATMGVREFETQVPYGVINVEHGIITGITEKPLHRHLINGGLYVLSPEILDIIPHEARYDMTDLFHDTAKRCLRAVAFPIREYWTDIGHLTDFEQANRHYPLYFGANDETR